MQEKRDYERKAGTGEIRMEDSAIASESMEVSEAPRDLSYQEEYQKVLDGISLDAETFTHPDPVYQVLAGQGNEEAERAMHLVHTTQSMQRAKEALANLPPGAGEDFSYDTESESAEDLGEGPSTTAEGPIPSWMRNTSVTHTELEDLFVAQYQDAHHKSLTASSTQKVIYQQIMDSLKLQRFHYLQTKEEV